MSNRIQETFEKSKWVLIIFLILWVALSIVLSTSITVSLVNSRAEDGVSSAGKFIDEFIHNIGNIGENLKKSFERDYISEFFKVEIRLTAILLLCATIGVIRVLPKKKNGYEGIENGSSDWAKSDKYDTLNRKKGIILAEKHYLPVDKRGNVNVLVVGRIWFSENLLRMLFQMHINY